MKDTIFYIAEIKRTQGIESDYAVSKLLGLSRQAMTKYKQHKATFDSDTCLIVGELLKISPLEVLTNIKASKSKKPELAHKWQVLAQQMSGITIAVILSVAVSLSPPQTSLQSPIIEFSSPRMPIMLSSALFLIWHYRPSSPLKALLFNRTFSLGGYYNEQRTTNTCKPSTFCGF